MEQPTVTDKLLAVTEANNQVVALVEYRSSLGKTWYTVDLQSLEDDTHGNSFYFDAEEIQDAFLYFGQLSAGIAAFGLEFTTPQRRNLIKTFGADSVVLEIKERKAHA